MSRNGSGTYNLPAGNPVVTGTTISSTWANTTLSDIASALTGSVASDGQTPMSANLNMATNKVVNVADPSNAQDAATKAYVDANIPNTSNFLTKSNNLSDVSSTSTSRTNLGAAASGANSDITSLSGLTTALSVAQGGTGANTLTSNNVLLGNGTSALQTVAPGTSGNVLTSNGTTWTSSAPSSSYVGARGQVFTSNGTFTIPTGVTAIKVTVVGGGGGGCGDNGAGSAVSGSNGGNSTVASGTQTITTITGGGGTGGNSNGNTVCSGGSGTNGDLNIAGGTTLGNARNTVGGSSILGMGGCNRAESFNTVPAGGYGAGGGAWGFANGGFTANYSYTQGAGGGSAIKFLTGLTPGATLAVTIGGGGAAGGSTYPGYAGTAGCVMIEW